MKNLKQALAQGEVLVGPVAVGASPALVEIIGYAGFDFVVIDCEHSALSPYGAELENMIRTALSAEVAPIVRTTWNDPGQVLKAMDMGASGVMVPHVNSAADAQALVRAAHYAPVGRRSAAPPTLASKRGFIDWGTYYEQARENTFVIPLVEEVEGVEHIEEIAAVPHLGMIWFGPFDLAVSLGRARDAYEPDVPAERERVYAAARANGLPIGDLAWDIESAEAKIRAGAQMLAFGTEATMLANACRTAVGAFSDLRERLVAVATEQR